MSVAAQYTSIAQSKLVTVSAANTGRDGTGTLAILATAPPQAANGRRFDRIQITAGGTTTVNVLRFFITEGRPGVTITSVTGSGTTATVTTSLPHGATTGNLVTLQNAFPFDYNVSGVAITVTGASTFTYTMATTPTVLTASTVGSYSTTPAVPVTRLWREVLVPAIVPSTSVSVFMSQMATGSPTDSGFMPLVLEPGYSLRVSTNNAETYYVACGNSGDFA